MAEDELVGITQLWVNGAAVRADDARLALGPYGLTWRVEADLGSHSPFRREFGLSMVLEDGRTAHGRAWMTSAAGDRVTFEGNGTLTGTALDPGAVPDLAPSPVVAPPD